MESEAPSGGRLRLWLLVALGIAVVALIASWMWPTTSATPGQTASNQGRAAQKPDQGRVDPADLEVRLDTLNAERPAPEKVERNPFRFQPRAAPPAPPAAGARSGGPALPPVAPADTGPPAPPPIPLKFIGTVEKQGLKIAALSDCRNTFHGSEGQIIDGRYRLVRIGVESVVLEYLDGRGRTTVRLEGCPPR